MQVVFKSFIFACLVCSITSENACHRNGIPFDHIQISALETSYSSRSIVRANCETGYVGFLKLSCQNGTWMKEGGRDCKKKPCGHPGDTPNGDFELIGDTEFVFGARVEYTCRPGYVMASRKNTRICRTQGWDNTIPICEVVRCPAILTSGDVIAIGNTEEASYEDVINFECASSSLMLDGPKDIHCKEDGTWSAPVPKCKEIECKPPVIQHGTITELKPIYKENEVLQYECPKKYKQRQGIPKCLRTGWSITAQCEEIICLLGPATIGIESTKPEGKNVFKAGESVDIACAKNYWLSVLKKKSGLIRCKDNGHWEAPPACEEIGCEIPYSQHVYWPEYYFSVDKRLGRSISYRCEGGYKRTAESATCTEDGWSPNPLCIEIGCSAPTIENTKPLTNPKRKYNHGESVVYQCLPGYEPRTFRINCNRNDFWDNMQSCIANQDTVQQCNSTSLTNGFTHYFTMDSDPPSQWVSYSCNEGYKPSEEGWWGQKSCRQGVLDNNPQCIGSHTCVGSPNIAHAKPSQIKETGAWEKVDCEYGFRKSTDYIYCVDGQWDHRVQCESVCGHPPQVENAVILPGDWSQWHIVTYECRDAFMMKGNARISCTKPDWQNAPKCELRSGACPRPTNEINNATIKDTSMVKDYYLRENTVAYKCLEGFKFKKGGTARCSQGTWNYPICIPLKIGNCGPPEQISDAVQELKEEYKDGETATYECSPNYVKDGDPHLTCKQGRWIGKGQCLPSPPSNRDEEEDVTQPDTESLTVRAPEAPEESVKTSDCGSPEQISDAVQEFKDQYKDGETATYECPAYYIKAGDPYLTCRQGRWIGKGQCLRPCTVDVHDMDPRNIELLFGGRRKIYAKHRDPIQFKCQEGYERKGKVAFRQLCLNGRIELPLCG